MRSDSRKWVQDDSGAEMHMLDSKAWCSLGYTEAVRMWVGTAKVEDSVERIDAVMPLIGVMDGDLDDGTPVSTIRFLGASALDFAGKYGRLLSRNGIEHGGIKENGQERVLDNEVMPKRGCLVFDQSTPEMRVKVPMRRWRRSSFVKIRVPTERELKAFLDVNPHLIHWTADALIDGSIRAKKVTLRGQAHDGLGHILATRCLTGSYGVGLSLVCKMRSHCQDLMQRQRTRSAIVRAAKRECMHRCEEIHQSRYKFSRVMWLWISSNLIASK